MKSGTFLLIHSSFSYCLLVNFKPFLPLYFSLLPSRLVDAIYEAFLALHTGNDPDAVVAEVLAKVEEDGAEDR